MFDTLFATEGALRKRIARELTEARHQLHTSQTILESATAHIGMLYMRIERLERVQREADEKRIAAQKADEHEKTLRKNECLYNQRGPIDICGNGAEL